MKEWYLETKNGNILLDHSIIKKYNLRMGTLSPFTGNRIVGRHGRFDLEPIDNQHGLDEIPEKGFKRDGIFQMDNGFELSTSEIIDISQGEDSDVEYH